MPSSHDQSHDSSLEDPTRSVNPRLNGWECPWHPFQVISWIMVLLFTICHYGFLVFYFPHYWRYIGYIVPGLLFLVHVISIIITTSIDPAESNVRAKLRGGDFKRGQFDPSSHAHVIENLHCHLCDADVSTGAKHCRLCDKCIYEFDHHCKWLNNCIGKRNYKFFMVAITSGLLGVLSLTITSTVFFILFFAARDNVQYYCDIVVNITECSDALRILGLAIPDPLFPTVTVMIGIVATIAVVLLGYLTCFHFYLISKGLSTYDYIVQQRNDDDDERLEQQMCDSLHKKRNKIIPISLEEGTSDELGEESDNSSLSSQNSAGKMTFSRTPPHSDNEEDPIIINNSLTNEEINNFAAIALSPVKTHENGCHDNHITETRLAEKVRLPTVTQDDVTTPTLPLVEMAIIPETNSQLPHKTVTFSSDLLPSLESTPLQLTDRLLLPPIEDKTTPTEPSINSATV